MILLDREAVDERLHALEVDLVTALPAGGRVYEAFEEEAARLANAAADRRYVFREALAILERVDGPVRRGDR